MDEHAIEGQRMDTLRALCDTVVPAIEHAPDPYGHWARSASSYGVPEGVAQALTPLPDDQRAGLCQLLDVLAAQGLLTASQASREQLLRNVSLGSPDAAAGIAALGGLTILLHYGAPDPTTGRNPCWDMLGYPGPLSAPPSEPKTIEPLRVDAETTLQADVVVVGSGAGGSVIAAELARRGASVVVVEAGEYFNEADFNQYELWAWQNLYWRGGPTPTADRNVTLQAGSCLGGGTVVNWTNSIRTKEWVRQEWASQHGLSDVAEDFDRHLDAVWERLSVSTDCCDLNRPHQIMKRAAEALGWSFVVTNRNADASRYDPASAAYMGFGDQSGSKQSTMRTYLQDAVDAGARIVVGCFVEQVLVEGGRAAGILGHSPATGARLTVQAPNVVLAAGALESPGVLLRSGIGGPAVGRYLRLHPCTAVGGTYGEDIEGFWGAPHVGLVDEFAPLDDGYGFLIEGVQYTTGLAASATPWQDAHQHKEALEDFRHVATLIGLLRDRGDDNGQVVVDASGMAQPFYSLRDAADQDMSRRALEAQIRMHAAAGAHQISALADSPPIWHRGEDLEQFITTVNRIPLRAGGMRLFAAHQMGTCRMGTDPATSVATPTGELHDTPGVWIGDTSAFPTSSGTNPMITVMALAHRTAEKLADAAGAGAPAGAAAETALQEA
ncbi:MAG: FAD-dependent oxidoreductase [Solirubrobacteraceae bacterium]